MQDLVSFSYNNVNNILSRAFLNLEYGMCHRMSIPTNMHVTPVTKLFLENYKKLFRQKFRAFEKETKYENGTQKNI